MATPYEKIYNRFSQKITDFNLVELDNDSLGEMLLGWLNSAIVRMRRCKHDLTKRDDELLEFAEDLSDIELELLAMGMVDAWVSQYLNSTENVLQMVAGKEEKFFSQASHIAELRSIKEENLREMNRLHNYYTYTNNSYFDN
jgi:hypothetical protein